MSVAFHPEEYAEEVANGPSFSDEFKGIELIEVPFRFKGVEYMLREADEDAACKYRNKLTASAKWGPDGKIISMGSNADVQPMLVSMCLFTKAKVKLRDGQQVERDVNVDEKEIRKWPTRIIRKIFEKIINISELAGDDTEESLQKEIDELTKRLDKLKAEKEAGRETDPAKKEQNDTMDS